MRVFREKISGATADRPQLRKLLGVVTHGDVVIIPAVDRLSRDTTDLLVIARELQNAGAGLRSIAEPVVGATSGLAELVLAMRGVAAKLERRRIMERTERGRAIVCRIQSFRTAAMDYGDSFLNFQSRPAEADRPALGPSSTGWPFATGGELGRSGGTEAEGYGD
jgi:Resolvase, N terminal domain